LADEILEAMMWKQAYLETKVLSADPLELVAMLYDAALASVAAAREHLSRGEIRARSEAISKAISILTELATSLDHDAGGDLSRNLTELYSYIQRRLIEANLNQSDGPLAETQGLLLSLSEAWEVVRSQRMGTRHPESNPFADSGADKVDGLCCVPGYASGSISSDASADSRRTWSA
jgi:flagellar protein FliS